MFQKLSLLIFILLFISIFLTVLCVAFVFSRFRKNLTVFSHSPYHWHLLTSCDRGRDENQQVFSRGFYFLLCSSNRVCLFRYPSQVFLYRLMGFFLFSDVGETRREGQIWFPLSHVVTWEAISSHANNIWGLWEVSIICFSANCCFQLIVCTLVNNLVYVSSKRFSNCFDVVHVSEPYRSMFSTQVLNKFNFVLVEKPEVIMVWSLLQAT